MQRKKIQKYKITTPSCACVNDKRQHRFTKLPNLFTAVQISIQLAPIASSVARNKRRAFLLKSGLESKLHSSRGPLVRCLESHIRNNPLVECTKHQNSYSIILCNAQALGSLILYQNSVYSLRGFGGRTRKASVFR